jgi:hypothetical protein
MTTSWKSTGIMAELQASGLAQKTINDTAKMALYLAADEFFQDPQGFQLRFSPRAYTELGLSQRAPGTIRRKMKVFGGRDLPNVSPRRKGSAHLREILKVRGTGYNIKTIAKQGIAEITVTLPGARKQNQYGYKWEKYGKELFTLTGAQTWQAQQIMKRALEIFKEQIWQEFNKKTPVYWSA